jgi:hypothetical protein
VNKRQQKTLKTISAKPDRNNIPWDDFISVLQALGADLTEKGGSMLGVCLNGKYAVFHQPHPGREIYPSDLKRIRRYLREAGIDL